MLLKAYVLLRVGGCRCRCGTSKANLGMSRPSEVDNAGRLGWSCRGPMSTKDFISICGERNNPRPSSTGRTDRNKED
jgi:hypothetical protein